MKWFKSLYVSGGMILYGVCGVIVMCDGGKE